MDRICYDLCACPHTTLSVSLRRVESGGPFAFLGMGPRTVGSSAWLRDGSRGGAHEPYNLHFTSLSVRVSFVLGRCARLLMRAAARQKRVESNEKLRTGGFSPSAGPWASLLDLRRNGVPLHGGLRRAEHHLPNVGKRAARRHCPLRHGYSGAHFLQHVLANGICGLGDLHQWPAVDELRQSSPDQLGNVLR